MQLQCGPISPSKLRRPWLLVCCTPQVTSSLEQHWHEIESELEFAIESGTAVCAVLCCYGLLSILIPALIQTTTPANPARLGF